VEEAQQEEQLPIPQAQLVGVEQYLPELVLRPEASRSSLRGRDLIDRQS